MECQHEMQRMFTLAESDIEQSKFSDVERNLKDGGKNIAHCRPIRLTTTIVINVDKHDYEGTVNESDRAKHYQTNLRSLE